MLDDEIFICPVWSTGMSYRSFQALAILLMLCALTAAAQQTPQKKDRKKDDPQNKYEPRSSPGVGQKFLEKFVGDWDVIKKFHPRTGDPVEMKGECRQTMVHEGRFLKSEFVFQQAGGKSTGTGLIGFDS